MSSSETTSAPCLKEVFVKNAYAICVEVVGNDITETEYLKLAKDRWSVQTYFHVNTMIGRQAMTRRSRWMSRPLNRLGFTSV